MHDKHQTIEEPDDAKVSRTVLKTNGVGNNLVEFNPTGDKRAAETWVDAILAHQSAQLQKVDNQTLAQAELNHFIFHQRRRSPPQASLIYAPVNIQMFHLSAIALTIGGTSFSMPTYPPVVDHTIDTQ